MEGGGAECCELQLKCMNLYKDAKIQFVLRAAVQIAYAKGDDLTPSDFTHLDHLHYLGPASATKLCEENECSQDTRLVDIGAGLAGPARFLAHKFGCRVCAVEYQKNLCRAGTVLNRLQNLSERVQMVHGDITSSCWIDDEDLRDKHSLAVSQLALLHIPTNQRRTALSNCNSLLKQGAKFLIEDFFIAGNGSEQARNLLKHHVAVPEGNLPTKEEYLSDLGACGFVVESWTDVTEQWTQFIWERFEAFLKNPGVDDCTEFGKTYCQEMAVFYGTMAQLFHSGSFVNTETLKCQYPSAFSHFGEMAVARFMKEDQYLRGLVAIVVKK